MNVYMFPGQGSQAKGMGGELFDEFPELVKKADKILGYSIKELCLEDPGKELADTRFTQPALYVVSALSFMKKMADGGDHADFLMGHSLGELNALQAAGAFSFESGLKIVKKRGELMSQAEGGGMAAVLNASKEQIESILKDNGFDGVDLANFNTPTQIVVSGKKDDMAKIQPLFEKDNMLFYPLNTSGAFHSRYMQDIKGKFENYLRKFKFKPLQTPVIANVTAEPYSDDEVIENLASQLTGSVRWTDGVGLLLSKGDVTFTELGHGDVLTKMVASIQRHVEKSSQSDEAQSSVPKQTASPNPKPQAENKEDQQATKSKPKTQTNLHADMSGKNADEKVALWNERFPVGTKVKSSFTSYDDLETSSEATVLFGHRAAVYMKGYKGYFDIDELEVI